MTTLIDALEPAAKATSRIDFRWRLATAALAVVLSALLRGSSACALSLLVSLVVLAGSGVDWRSYWLRLAPVLSLLVLFAIWLPFLPAADGYEYRIGPLSASARGLNAAACLIFKGSAIFTFVMSLLTVASFDQLLRAAAGLHVPAWMLQLTLLTYRYLFVLAGEFKRIRVALRVRGFRNRPGRQAYRTVGHVTGTLLVRGSNRALRIGQAMRCRGFAGRWPGFDTRGTSWMEPATFVVITATLVAILSADWAHR